MARPSNSNTKELKQQSEDAETLAWRVGFNAGIEAAARWLRDNGDRYGAEHARHIVRALKVTP